MSFRYVLPLILGMIIGSVPSDLNAGPFLLQQQDSLVVQCKKLHKLQKEVNTATSKWSKVVEANPKRIKALKGLARQQKAIGANIARVIAKLRAEGCIVFVEVFVLLHEDSIHVQRDLARGRITKATTVRQQDLVDTFQEAIHALQKK